MLHFQQGNTIRMTVEFHDWNGAMVDPSIVKFIAYDTNFKKTNEWLIGIANRIDAGSYFFDFVADQFGTIFLEWYCEMMGFLAC